MPNKYDQGWRENQDPTTTLKDLKESVEQLNQPFGGMLDENKGIELNFLCESSDEFIKENEKELKYLFGESWQEEGLDTWNDKMTDYANDNR